MTKYTDIIKQINESKERWENFCDKREKQNNLYDYITNIEMNKEQDIRELKTLSETITNKLDKIKISDTETKELYKTLITDFTKEKIKLIRNKKIGEI